MTNPSQEQQHEYSAWFKTSRQISESEWEVYRPMLKVTDSTTVGEIRKWYESLRSHKDDPFTMDNIVITQLSPNP